MKVSVGGYKTPKYKVGKKNLSLEQIDASIRNYLQSGEDGFLLEVNLAFGAYPEDSELIKRSALLGDYIDAKCKLQSVEGNLSNSKNRLVELIGGN